MFIFELKNYYGYNSNSKIAIYVKPLLQTQVYDDHLCLMYGLIRMYISKGYCQTYYFVVLVAD